MSRGKVSTVPALPIIYKVDPIRVRMWLGIFSSLLLDTWAYVPICVSETVEILLFYGPAFQNSAANPVSSSPRCATGEG